MISACAERSATGKFSCDLRHKIVRMCQLTCYGGLVLLDQGVLIDQLLLNLARPEAVSDDDRLGKSTISGIGISRARTNHYALSIEQRTSPDLQVACPKHREDG